MYIGLYPRIGECPWYQLRLKLSIATSTGFGDNENSSSLSLKSVFYCYEFSDFINIKLRSFHHNLVIEMELPRSHSLLCLL